MERLDSSYHLVNKFSSEGDAQEACDRVSEYLTSLRETDNQVDLFTRPFQRNSGWHVIVSGIRPDRRVEERIEQYLSSGEPTSLPPDILAILLHREALIRGGSIGRR